MNGVMLRGRILLIDDHPLFHEGLASALRHSDRGLTLVGVETVARGLSLVDAGESFDLVLIDLMMPDHDGLRALGLFGEAAPWLPRVLLSGRIDREVVLRARRGGACGFIAKSWSVRRIVEAIYRVIGGGVDFSVLDDARAPHDAIALTERQSTVLSLLAQGKSNKDMARALDIADRTVRAHLTDLYLALGASSRVQALIHAQRAGLIAAHGDGAPV